MDIIIRKAKETDSEKIDFNGKIAGVFVYCFLPYTAKNSPSIYMKEIYLDENYGGQQIG